MASLVSPLRHWFLGFVLAVFCCGVGVVVALVVQQHEGPSPSFRWAFAICLFPSLVAGALWARILARPRRREGGEEEDPLTGLQGEARLREALEADWARSKRLHKHVGLVIVELEQAGRMSVPQYLAWRAMARTLKAAVRVYDSSYVLTPGRFAILLSATTEEAGRAVIERLRKGMLEVPELAGVTIRFGQAVGDPGAEGAEGPAAPNQLLEKAILAAHHAEPEQPAAVLRGAGSSPGAQLHA